MKNMKNLKEDLNLLVELKPKLFKYQQKTKISYYTFT